MEFIFCVRLRSLEGDTRLYAAVQQLRPVGKTRKKPGFGQATTKFSSFKMLS